MAWGQSAWVHFSDLRRRVRPLRPGPQAGRPDRRRGSVPPAGTHVPWSRPGSSSNWKSLWAAHLTDQDHWVEAAERQGFRTIHQVDLTAALRGELAALREAETRSPRGVTNPEEMHAWDLADALIDDEVLGYQRLVFQLTTLAVD